MSYYNFNDHFWSPKTVCVQKSVINLQETPKNRSKTKIFLYTLCIVICTPLLFSVYSSIANKNSKNALINDSNCLILTRNQAMQLYCSNTQN